MTIIPYKNEEEYQISKNISAFLKNNQVNEIFKKSNAKKEQGIPLLRIFGALILMIFTGKSLNRLIDENSYGFEKDTVYRFINSFKIQWQTFIALLAFTVISRITTLTSEKRMNTLILDDTINKRNRSKKVELLAKVMDHTDGKYYRGFRCLTAAFSDGNTIIPTGFNVLSSQNEKSRLNESRENIDKRTNGYKRREKAQLSMYEAAYDLVGAAQKRDIPFSHVLFDSWFSMPVMFRTLCELDVHGLGMLKNTPNVLYKFGNKMYSLQRLYDLVKSKIPKDKDTYCVTVTLVGDGKEKQDLRFKIVFVNDKRAKNNWCAIGTTDLTLTEEQIVVLYSRRWDIEVFFKTCKEHLGFAKDFQSRSYDAVTASVAIVFTRYIMLAVEVRNNTDARTGGELFFYIYDEIRERVTAEALFLFWEYMIVSLSDFISDFNEIQRFQSLFINSLPSFLRDLLCFSGCET